MISAKNYAAQAERDFLKHAKEANDEQSRKLYKNFASGINISVHFAMPDNGKIFDDNLKGLVGQELRLPYRMITLEYSSTIGNVWIDLGNDLVTEVPSTKSLILAVELEGEVLDAFRKEVHENWHKNSEEFAKEGRGNWFYTTDRVLHVILFKGLKKEPWTVNGFGMVVNGYWDNEKGVIGFHLPADIRQLQVAEDANLISHVCDSAEAAVGELLEFLEALTCKNVKEAIHQSERKNNAKWVKLGKLPMYETRVLTIDTGEKQFTKAGSGENFGRTHASPRQHLRRGHIRRLEGGNIWVNSCVVGSSENGVLDKTYKIK